MTFVEWYEEEHGNHWHEDYAEIPNLIEELEDKYSDYCHENDIEPIWNG